MPPGEDFSLVLDGETRPMCCPGCRAVAGLIAGAGLTRFYAQRTAYNERPLPGSHQDDDRYTIFDDPELAATFCTDNTDGTRSARLLVGGMTCAACTWLIEHSLQKQTGVGRAAVNLAQARLNIDYDPAQVKLSTLFTLVAQLGYRVQPFRSSSLLEQLRAEHRQDLRRLAVAGIGMMQVGMFAIALHAGDIQGIALEYRELLRWVSLLVASFVVLFSARGFFTSAWQHLRRGALVMDLPVALAIGLAFSASVVATLGNTGQVYFDSVVMFTFLLLLARFVEKRLRLRDAFTWFDAECSLPESVLVRDAAGWCSMSRHKLQAGSEILVPAGETVPLDAIVCSGHSAVREDAFSGESLPRTVSPGSKVFAGTVNEGQSIEIRALGSYRDSRLAALQRSVEEARGDKPRLAILADRLAAWFIAGILLATNVTAFAWWQVDPDKAFWVSLSVLVISCPCALALATPAALANAAAALRSRGILVTGENALETLSRATHLLFDKTGTLTRGELQVAETQALADASAGEVLAIAASLQQHSSHPAATAFSSMIDAVAAQDVEYHMGAGLEGLVGSTRYRLGSEAFCREWAKTLPPAPNADRYWIALCCPDRPLAWIGLDDPLRAEAGQVIRAARMAGLQLEIVSGDREPRVTAAASLLGLDRAGGGLSPQDKIARVLQLQSQGAVVAMVGDGLNDAPVLALADTSIAVAGATDLARTQADFVIMDGDLRAVSLIRQMAQRCRRIILQNFAWALGYNTLAIPLAALGYIPPWAAAVGMSLSSLLVVGNSLRLRHR